LNWEAWIRRWDRQQSGYLPDREQRFTAMLNVLEALLPEHFVALDNWADSGFGFEPQCLANVIYGVGKPIGFTVPEALYLTISALASDIEERVTGQRCSRTKASVSEKVGKALLYHAV